MPGEIGVAVYSGAEKDDSTRYISENAGFLGAASQRVKSGEPDQSVVFGMISSEKTVDRQGNVRRVFAYWTLGGDGRRHQVLDFHKCCTKNNGDESYAGFAIDITGWTDALSARIAKGFPTNFDSREGRHR